MKPKALENTGSLTTIRINQILVDEINKFLKDEPNSGYENVSEFVEDAIYIWLRLHRPRKRIKL